MKVPNADRLRRVFLLTVEKWVKVYEYQKGCCAICGNPLPDHCTLTDHDHKTGLFRGLLCFRCNAALRDYMDVAFLEKALVYMKNPTATAALGGPHFGLPHRVGTKVQRKLAAKLKKQKIHTSIRTSLGEQKGPHKNDSR
jgi:Recombination endonuclease VII